VFFYFVVTYIIKKTFFACTIYAYFSTINYKREEEMGKIRRFLAVFVSLFVIAISGNALAEGYTCDAIKEYTSCVAGRHLSKTGPGNSCDLCPSNSTSGEGNNTIYCTCKAGYHVSGSAQNVTQTSGTACVANTYTITLNKQNGTGAVSGGSGWTASSNPNNTSNSTVTCTYGQTVTLPTGGLSKTGYTYKGWNTASGQTSGNTTTYTCTENKTFYAAWQNNVYTITLNDNGGSGGNGTVYEKYGVGYSLSNFGSPITSLTKKPTKSGVTVTFNANSGSVTPGSASTSYTFNGYYTATSGGTQRVTAALALPGNTTFTSNTTLYAQWSCNGVSLPTPTRSGYTFNGWFTAASGGTQVTGTYCPTSNTTLYAHWTAKTNTITLNKNGGTGTCGGATGIANGSTTCTTGSSKSLPSWDGSSCNIINGNKVFRGWSTNTTATSGTTSITCPTSNTTYYAAWCTPTCTPTNGTCTITTPSNNAPRATITCSTGYSQSGGTNRITSFTVTGTDGSCSVSGTCYPMTSTVSFNLNDGSDNLPANVTATYGASMPKLSTSANPWRDGYTFGGWYDTSASYGGMQYYDASRASARTWDKTDASVILYARWTPNTYTITLNDNNGSGGSGTAKEVYATKWTNSSGTTITSVTPPTRSGYAFRGYYTAQVADLSENGSTGTQRVTKAGTLPSTTTFTANTTLYAAWAKNCNPGLHCTCSLSITDNGAVTYSTGSDDGYHISSGSGTATPSCAANTYTVVYNKNATSATGTTASSTHTYDVEKTLTANGFTNGTNKFIGWATSASTSATYTNQASVKNLTTVNNGTVILYAKWASAGSPDGCKPCDPGDGATCTLTAPQGVCTYTTDCKLGYDNLQNAGKYNPVCDPITYTIKYDGNGNTGGSTANSNHVYNTAKKLTKNGYTKTNSIFDGWAESDNGPVKYADEESVINVTTENGKIVKLYAKWTDCKPCSPGTGAICTLSVVNNACTYSTDCKPGYNTLVNGGQYNPSCTPNTYTVAFNGNNATGGAANPTSIKCIYDQNCPAFATRGTLYKNEYRFGDWNSNAAGTGTHYAAGLTTAKNLTTQNNATVTLHAVWNSCDPARNGTGSTVSLTTTTGSCVYTGICLTGYSTTGGSNRGTTCTGNGCSCAKITSNVTLDKQNGTGGTSNVTPTYGDAMPTATMPTRSNYIFAGYYDKTSGGTQYYGADGTSVHNWDKTDLNVTLYARWGTSECAACNPGKGATCTYNGVVNNACSYTTNCENGYTNLSGDGTATPSCTPITYTISYTLNGGTNNSDNPASYTIETDTITLKSATRSDYLFDAWYAEASFTNKVTQIVKGSTGNKTFYAKWNKCPDHATCENNTITCEENYNLTEDRECILGTIECVEGKYYTGTGTEMADCKKEYGFFCPGTGVTPINGGVGCRVSCPTSTDNGHLSTTKDGATNISQCQEEVENVDIKYEDRSVGVGDKTCGYSRGTDGNAVYENGCQTTVKSCIKGFYVPEKGGEEGYVKAGRCEPVGKGYYRAGIACNLNPTSKENDDCMRKDCPPDGTTNHMEAESITECFVQCSENDIKDGTIPAGHRTPVDPTPNYNGTAYPACTYNVSCATGYNAVDNGKATATCEPVTVKITLDDNGGTGGSGEIYAKYNHGWYSDLAAGTPIAKITLPTRPNYDFAGYKTTDGVEIINADGTFAVMPPKFTVDTTLTAVWHGIPVKCVKGKYYTGTGTLMAPCPSGAYCPGQDMDDAFQGEAGCYIKCPTSGIVGSTLSSPTSTDPNGVGATSISQCQETLLNVNLPKGASDANRIGTANSTCNYTSGNDGNAKYEDGCELTITSCIGGYYVPQKTGEEGYVKAGRCDPVGKGYYREGGTCNLNPTSEANDDCMRKKCPGDGTTEGDKTADSGKCFINCEIQDIIVGDKTVGTKIPVTDSNGNSRAYLQDLLTETYDVCYYNARCNSGYNPDPDPQDTPTGTTDPTCVLGSGWSVTYSDEDDLYTLTGNPIRNFTPETTDRTLPTSENVLRMGYTFTGWYEKADLTGTKLSEIPADRVTDITLYAKFEPNVYPVTVNSDNGTENKIIYMKYATGWYSDAAATVKIEKLDIPTKPGDEFGGYKYDYKNDEDVTVTVDVTNSTDGEFKTSSLTPRDNMEIYAKWTSQPIQCPAGKYYPGTGDIESCKPCESGYFCEGKTKCDSNDGNTCGRSECPEFTILSANISSSGTSPDKGAESVTQCRKSNTPYTSEDNKVTSGYANCPANKDNQYIYDDAKCTKHVITACKAGYYCSDTDGAIECAAKVCKEVDKGYWSGGNTVTRNQCTSRTVHDYTTNGDGKEPEKPIRAGTTTGTTSQSENECYLENIPYTPINGHGKGTQTCKWNEFSYSDCNPDTQKIRYCDAGYYRQADDAKECVPAGLNRFSTEGSLSSEQCPKRIDADGKLMNGETTTPTATSAAACLLRVPYDVPHGTGSKLCEFNASSGGDGQYDQNCSTPDSNWIITSCDRGYYRPKKADGTYENRECKPVGKNHYRPSDTCVTTDDGTEICKCVVTSDSDSCMRTECPDSGITDGEINDTVTLCYKQGLEYTSDTNHVTGGTQTCNATLLGQYTANCRDFNVTKCAAGYYRTPTTDSKICEEVGIGYWSEGNNTSREQCKEGTIAQYASDGTDPTYPTENGITETTHSTASTDCFLKNVPYEPANGHGKGTQTCKWAGHSYSNCDLDTQKIRYCDAGYYRQTDAAKECVPAGPDRYSTSGSLNSEPCPERTDADGNLKHGETPRAPADAPTPSGKVETAISAAACLLRVPYDVPHGTGSKLCEYNAASGESGQYDQNCNRPDSSWIITSCEGGYYRPIVDGKLATDACVEVGQNYYRPAGACSITADHDTCMRVPCPAGGLTTGTTSINSTACYLDRLMCPITNGSGQNTCHHNGSANMTIAAYDTNCTACLLTECDDGYSKSENMCIACPANMVCSDNSETTCAVLTGGKYTKSDPGTSDVSGCYRDCALGEHATAMTGRDYYNNNQCEITACEAGYILSGGKCQPCPPGYYCPTDKQQIKCPVDWSNSDGTAVAETDCYRTCEAYPIKGGTAIPVAEKAFWPNKCEFKGESDDGNECEIIDGECVEISCRNIFEMINGTCVPCNRPHALSYLPKGNCMVASCEIGYHPNGQYCEGDIKQCNAPHATRASQKWDSKLNSFSTCQIEECEEGYHIASNACVANEQVCAVEHGVGIKEWNTRTNSWGDCVATSCDAGYTNDPSETNERSKQCGQCKNKFSVLGEVAASTYIRGCEIATCLYQGELYNLENNECVPICEVDGFEDETGTRKWDPSRKKCVRSCKAGYTMW